MECTVRIIFFVKCMSTNMRIELEQKLERQLWSNWQDSGNDRFLREYLMIQFKNTSK